MATVQGRKMIPPNFPESNHRVEIKRRRIQQLLDSGSLQDAMLLIDKLHHEKHVLQEHAYRYLVSVLGKKRCYELYQAIKIIDRITAQLTNLGYELSSDFYKSAALCYARKCSPDKVLEIKEIMMQKEMPLDQLDNFLLLAYGNVGDFGKMNTVFAELVANGTVNDTTYRYLVECFGKARDLDAVSLAIKDMTQRGVKIDEVNLRAIKLIYDSLALRKVNEEQQ